MKTGYAAKKKREQDTFYKPLCDGLSKHRKGHNLSDTFMPAQMVELRKIK